MWYGFYHEMGSERWSPNVGEINYEKRAGNAVSSTSRAATRLEIRSEDMAARRRGSAANDVAHVTSQSSELCMQICCLSILHFHRCAYVHQHYICWTVWEQENWWKKIRFVCRKATICLL